MIRTAATRSARQYQDGAHVVLTGATGFVGAAVLAELLSGTASTITCLVRADDDDHARSRALSAAERWLGVEGRGRAADRVIGAAADLELDGMGLPAAACARLAERSTHVVHAAASVRFDNPLPVARAINVGGTRRVLELAAEAQRRGGLRRAAVISTTFVGGTTPRRFAEYDLDVGQDFRNSYERSKYEAELLARRWADRLPLVVVRPSIVVGDSSSGRGAASSSICAPLRLLLRQGAHTTLPLRADTPVDTVAVDWVARLTVEALLSGRDGQTYHAAAGRASLTAGEVASLASSAFGVAAPALLPAGTAEGVVAQSADAWTRRLDGAGRAGIEVFAPYLMSGSRFDALRGDHLMWRAGVTPPDPRATLRQTLEHARGTSFGRLRAPRRPPEASGRPAGPAARAVAPAGGGGRADRRRGGGAAQAAPARQPLTARDRRARGAGRPVSSRSPRPPGTEAARWRPPAPR